MFLNIPSFIEFNVFNVQKINIFTSEFGLDVHKYEKPNQIERSPLDFSLACIRETHTQSNRKISFRL